MAYDSMDEAGEAGGPAGGGAPLYPGDAAKKLDDFDEAIDAHWANWYPRAEEWFNIQSGEQWPQEALDQFELDGRTSVVFNRVDPTIDAISGAEIGNRQEVRYAPRELGDVAINELLTNAVKWSRDECDAGDEESQAFRDVLIAGLAATETTMDYDDDPEGQARVDRISPLELGVDPASRKTNYVGARFFRWRKAWDVEDAEEMFPELDVQAGEGGDDAESDHVTDPRKAYKGEGRAPLAKNQVLIDCYQWWERRRWHQFINPLTGELETLDHERFKALAQRFAEYEIALDSASFYKKTWWRAWRVKGGESAPLVEPLPDGEFTVKFITGKIDEITGLPYGAVKAMVDPQRWTNKFLVQMDRLIAQQAKGGVILNRDAFEDHEAVEERWARSEAIEWADGDELRAGLIMQQKPIGQYPAGWERLLQYATAALPDVVGVNKELLGQADRQQAGVLEFQRKQAAFGVLSTYFDHLTRYRKEQGRLHLKLIMKYMSDGRLIRISGENDSKQYVPLLPQVRDPDTARFDIIVDETPAGPNQQERVWNMLMGLGPVMKALAGLPSEIVVAILEYSPLPSSLVAKLKEVALKASQPDPAAQAAQQAAQQLQMADAQAKVAKTSAEAQLAQARAQSETIDAQIAQWMAGAAPQAPGAPGPDETPAQMQLRLAQAAAAFADADLTRSKIPGEAAKTGLTTAQAANQGADFVMKQQIAAAQPMMGAPAMAAPQPVAPMQPAPGAFEPAPAPIMAAPPPAQPAPAQNDFAAVMAALAHGLGQLAAAIGEQNRIALAPTEMLRDEAGRPVGAVKRPQSLGALFGAAGPMPEGAF